MVSTVGREEREGEEERRERREEEEEDGWWKHPARYSSRGLGVGG